MLSITIQFLVCSFASAQVYAVDLIEPPPGSFHTYGYGINDSGDVAGFHVIGVGVWQGFHWDGTTFTTLVPLPGGSLAEAYDLNNSDAIVGMSADGSGVPRAVRWSAPGALPADLGDLGGPDARASAINAGGTITGLAKTALGWGHAFRHAGAMEDLNDLGGLGSWGYDVNTGGSIVGWSNNPGVGPEAVYWSPGATAPTSIHNPALFTYSYAEGIADGEIVTGWAGTAGGAVHGFRWTPASGMTDLGSPVGACTPYEVNAANWIVATCGFLGATVAYARTPGGSWVNLNDQVPHGCGIVMEEARAINASGQIAGFGTKIGTSDLRAYRLTPVPSGLALGRLTPALAGLSNEISILGGSAGTKVYLVGNLTAGATSVPGCPGLAVDVAGAMLVDTETVDGSKRATFRFLVPLVMAGRSGLLQAVEHSSCRKSNVVKVAIG